MLKKIVTNFLIFSIFSTNFIANAKDEKKLDLNDLIKLTLENNQKIKIEKERLKLINADFYNARSIPNPSFMFEGSYEQSAYKIGLQNNIELGDKRNLRISEVDSKKILLEGQIELLNQEVLFELKKTYYQIYYLQEKIKKYEELIQINNKFLNIVEKKELAGDIPKLDVTQVKLVLLNLKNEKDKNTYQLELEESILENIIGKKVLINDILIKPFQKLNNCLNLDKKTKNQIIDFLIQKAINNRYEIKDFNNKKINLDDQKKLAKAKFFPNLNFYYGLDIFKENNIKTGLFTNLGIEIPVFDLKKGDLKEVEVKLEINDLEKAFFINNLTIEVKKAYQTYTYLLSVKENYEKNILPLTQEVSQKSQISFSLGKSSILSAINAQQTLVNQQLNYLQVLADYNHSVIDLERLIPCI